MTYAIVIDGVVVNTIRLHPMSAYSFENAVYTNGLPVAVGDTYVDGKFYRNGEELKPYEQPEGDDDMAAALEMLEVRMNG